MRKKREITVRHANPESKFGSELISKFVCQIMKDGKKNAALKIVYLFLNKVIYFQAKNNKQNIYYLDSKQDKIYIQDENNLKPNLVLYNEQDIIINPESYLEEMLNNLLLTHGLRSIKIGGTTYRIPYILTPRVKLFKAMKMFRDICRTYSKKNGVKFNQSLFIEYQNIYNNMGECLKTINGIQKTIQSNLAYANMFRRKKVKK